jgi:hypothetical protein
MANLFTKYKGLEFFGTYENFTGNLAGGVDAEYNQYAAEGLIRFGKNEQFYSGLRYNTVKNHLDMSVDRFQLAAGWFLIKQVVIKLEYVNQNYNEFLTAYGKDAGFKGVMFEAAISF